MFPPLKYGEEGAENEVRLTSRGLEITHPSQTMFFLPPIDIGPPEERTTISISSKGIETTTRPPLNSFGMPMPGKPRIIKHEWPAPLVAGATAVAAVAAVGALATAGVPTALAAGAVAATTAAATSGSDDFVPVEGYYRDDGTYVRAHNRTHPDGWEGNNFTS